jgi:hypothetical protein
MITWFFTPSTDRLALKLRPSRSRAAIEDRRTSQCCDLPYLKAAADREHALGIRLRDRSGELTTDGTQ